MMHYPRRVPIVTRFLPLVLQGKVSAVRVGYCNRFVMPQIDVLLDEKVLIGSTHLSSVRSAHEVTLITFGQRI